MSTNGIKATTNTKDSMETTLNTSDGSTAVVFTHRKTDDNEVLWTSPSPDDDFDGTRVVSRRASKSKTGILTRATDVKVPVKDPITGKYRFVQARLTLSAPSDMDNTEAEKATNVLLGLMVVGSNPTFKGEFVNGIDAF